MEVSLDKVRENLEVVEVLDSQLLMDMFRTMFIRDKDSTLNYSERRQINKTFVDKLFEIISLPESDRTGSVRDLNIRLHLIGLTERSIFPHGYPGRPFEGDFIDGQPSVFGTITRINLDAPAFSLEDDKGSLFDVVPIDRVTFKNKVILELLSFGTN